MALGKGAGLDSSRTADRTAGISLVNRIDQATLLLRETSLRHLMVWINFIIVVIRWNGLAPWEFVLPFSGSLTSTFLCASHSTRAALPHSWIPRNFRTLRA